MQRTMQSVLAATLLLAGCTRDAPRANPSEPPVTQPSASGPSMPPAGVAPPAMTGPAALAPAIPAAPASPALEGTVVETMDAAGYTYAKLDSGTAQIWVAGPETKLAVGTKIGATTGTLMAGFRSTTLNRTFDEIYFIASFPIAGAAPPNPHASGAVATPTTKPAPMTTSEKIEAAPGGQTVAQVIAGAATLAGKAVVVRGKVVKVNNQILGHNWLHIQDGSGDLTVTSDATAALGDVVVVRGTVATNKDFGAGYKYAVLVENAAVSAK